MHCPPKFLWGCAPYSGFKCIPPQSFYGDFAPHSRSKCIIPKVSMGNLPDKVAINAFSHEVFFHGTFSLGVTQCLFVQRKGAWRSDSDGATRPAGDGTAAAAR